MHFRTRFAPSPTGFLHLGHAYAAHIAREVSGNGSFFLRFEDIDATRTREEYYAAAEEDLAWLGFRWIGEPLRQTTRAGAYQSALEKLIASGFAYPCFCTRREIREEWERMNNAPHGPEEILYPGTCRSIPQTERTARIANGEAHAWRLDAAAARQKTGHLDFTDRRFGKIPVDPSISGDVILSRKDIGPAYHLAVVVDDAFQEITHVTRGADLLPATHIHRTLQTLLELPEPSYFHHRLILDETGKRLAKRHDALAIRTLRAAGLTPAQVFARFLPA